MEKLEPKGKDLTALADKYFFEGMEEGNYEAQLKELLYLQDMANSGEVRLAFNEWGMMYTMLRKCEQALGQTSGLRSKFSTAVSSATSK